MKNKKIGISILIIGLIFLTIGLIFGLISLFVAFQENNIKFVNIIPIIVPIFGLFFCIYFLIKAKK